MNREEKKAQFKQTTNKRLPLLVLAAVLVIGGAVAAWALLPGGSQGIKLVKAENGVVRIPQKDFADGTARFYKVRGANAEISFFVVQSQDGVIRAAFDTCDVCYKEKKGYRQEGNAMVCNNCNQSFRTDLINIVKGGCNPAPLARELRDGQVLIDVAALEQGASYFN